MRTLVIAALLLLQGPGGLRVASGVVSGQIRSAEGPAEGVRVSALVAPDNANAVSGTSSMLASLAQTDNAGRFRLEELPPGRYYIMAGALDYPSYYPGVKTLAEARVVTVTIGSTVSGIDFVLARPAGIRVSGRVKDLPAGAPEGLVRVILLPAASAVAAASGVALDAPVKPDGTFEFLKVGPGRYNARLSVATTVMSTTAIQVDDRDVKFEMSMGAGTVRFGRVVLENGGKLPIQMAAVASGVPDPPAAVRFQARRITVPAPAAATAAAVRGGVAGARGAATIQVTIQVRADGFFSFPSAAGAGEYQLVPMLMPLGLYLKSAVVDPATNQIQITLTSTPPASEPRGVKVSGRVSGLSPLAGQATRWVSLQTSIQGALGQTEQRIGEAPIRADGTFEVLNVPRGVANLNIVSPPGMNPPMPLQMRMDIADRDVFVEFSVSSSGAAGGPPAPPGAMPPPAPPITIILPDSPGAAPPPPPPITISAPPPPPLLRPPVVVQVSGTVTGLDPLRPRNLRTLTITLTQNGLPRFVSVIGVDGAFQFSGVSPGMYRVQLSLVSDYVLPQDFVVGEKDITGLVIAAPGP